MFAVAAVAGVVSDSVGLGSSLGQCWSGRGESAFNLGHLVRSLFTVDTSYLHAARWWWVVEEG